MNSRFGFWYALLSAAVTGVCSVGFVGLAIALIFEIGGEVDEQFPMPILLISAAVTVAIFALYVAIVFSTVKINEIDHNTICIDKKPHARSEVRFICEAVLFGQVYVLIRLSTGIRVWIPPGGFFVLAFVPFFCYRRPRTRAVRDLFAQSEGSKNKKDKKEDKKGPKI